MTDEEFLQGVRNFVDLVERGAEAIVAYEKERRAGRLEGPPAYELHPDRVIEIVEERGGIWDGETYHMPVRLEHIPADRQAKRLGLE